MRHGLLEQVDSCHQQIGKVSAFQNFDLKFFMVHMHANHSAKLVATRLYEKLLHLFNLTHIDNQEILRMLIPLKDDFPFEDLLSKEKVVFHFLKKKLSYLGTEQGVLVIFCNSYSRF